MGCHAGNRGHAAGEVLAVTPPVGRGARQTAKARVAGHGPVPDAVAAAPVVHFVEEELVQCCGHPACDLVGVPLLVAVLVGLVRVAQAREQGFVAHEVEVEGLQ